jgi:hypothetical protein
VSGRDPQVGAKRVRRVLVFIIQRRSCVLLSFHRMVFIVLGRSLRAALISRRLLSFSGDAHVGRHAARRWRAPRRALAADAHARRRRRRLRTRTHSAGVK